jgi:WhiB family redox-sensing transcriptional regulator
MKTIPDLTWMEEAKCRGMDPAIFVPDRKPAACAVSAALRACRSCPVVEQCLDYALSVPSVTGIWAATNAKERVVLRRRRREHHP